MAYITQQDLEDRLGAEVVKQLYDDNLDGTADAGPIARWIKDATSKVDSYLRGIYALPLALPVPNEVSRLTLDVAEAMAARRHPNYVRRNWQELMAAAEKDLISLRRGTTRLDVQGAPEPGANQGGGPNSAAGGGLFYDTRVNVLNDDGSGDF